MKKSNSISAAVCAAFIVTSGPAAAGNDLLKIGAGVALGVGIAKVIQHNKNKNGTQRQTSRSSGQSSGISAAQRQQNREVQTALNTFNFPVGGVDGQLGNRSKSAISNYQSYMGYPPTGYLDDYQRSRLVDSMYRFNNGGGNAYPNVVANEGTRGLLKAFNDPNYANNYNNQGNYNNQNNGNNDDVYGNDQNRVVEPEYNNSGADDSFEPLDLSLGQTSNSMATHCELVAGLTQANQGVVLASSISDPEQALGEQFCEARAYAITESQSLISQAPATPAKLEEQCTKIGAKLEPAFSGIGTQGVKVVAAKAQEITTRIFKSKPDAALKYGKICLGLGYRQDDANMALGGAAVLLATGQMPYAEIMGHHLRWGFGVNRSPVASVDWYDTALSAMEQGAQPVFVPSKTGERNAIIRAAINAPIGGVVPVQAAENDSNELPELSFD